MSDAQIRFRFDAKKAAQAAGRLLRLASGKRNYMELVKLLYLADREALLQLDSPITGDAAVSLPHGPVLSRVLDLIRWGPIDETDAPWFDAISPPQGYDVQLVPAVTAEDELSGAEIQILDRVFQKYGQMNWQELSRLTHRLPEWSAPKSGAVPITFEQILGLAGKSQEAIDRIKRDTLLYESLDQAVTACREESIPA